MDTQTNISATLVTGVGYLKALDIFSDAVNEIRNPQALPSKGSQFLGAKVLRSPYLKLAIAGTIFTACTKVLTYLTDQNK